MTINKGDQDAFVLKSLVGVILPPNIFINKYVTLFFLRPG